MILFVCLDDRDGMTFGGRRQSQDRAVHQDMLEALAGAPLWLTPYSAGQFSDVRALCIHEDPQAWAGEGEGCFAEDGPVMAAGVERLVVYRWNRHYPASRRFPWEAFDGWALCASRDFSGSSHDRITREEYIRNEDQVE